MSSAPDVRIDGDDVVFGPWEDWQGDYTALKLCDLLDFIESLERLPVRRFHGVSDTNPQDGQ